MEFNPSLKIKVLSSVDAGSLILFGDTYGFCIVSEGDPAKQRAVIRYDGTAFQYEDGHLAAGRRFRQGLYVEPGPRDIRSQCGTGTERHALFSRRLAHPRSADGLIARIRQSRDRLDIDPSVMADHERLPILESRGAHRR